MTFINRLLVLSLITFISSDALLAKRKPKVPKGPTLEETSAYIIQLLSTESQRSGGIPAAAAGGPTITSTTTLSNVRLATTLAVPAGCAISYDVKDEIDMSSSQFYSTDIDTYSVTLNLQSIVAGSLRISSGAVALRLANPENVATVHSSNRDLKQFTTEQSTGSKILTGVSFDFWSSETAERLGNALAHAIDLCGGGRVDPFKPR